MVSKTLLAGRLNLPASSRSVRALGASVLLATLTALPGTSAAQQCQNLVWSDEFDQTSLDTDAWDIQEGDGCDYGICGWGNDELQSYSADNLSVDNGVLTITARKERVKANNYTSGRIRTANMPASGQWTNGRFEARIKLPEGQGLWPAFWMLPTDPDVGWPMSGEIDILESTGQASMLAHGTIHYGEPWPDNSFTGAHILSQPAKWSDDFHTYAIEWTPYEMRWYVDDILYSVKTPDDMADSSWWTFENYQYHFLLNVAVGGTWGGTPDDSIFPVSMQVDYVRVYDLGQPSVDGDHIVAPNTQATYQVVDENGSSSSYTWTAPAGATIVSGQGTSAAQIDFTGATSGDVTVEVANSCSTKTLTVPVFIEPDHGVETMLDDFDGNQAMTYTSYTGTFDTTGGVLTYTRDGASQWDVIAASTSAIPDAAPYLSGDKAFVMDVNNTDPALVGKQILVQLEDSSTATPDNYPTGRHSKYEAFIEHANGWQTLRFRLADRIDGETTNTDVDSILFLIDPDAFTNDTYVIDNIAILGDGSSGSGGDSGDGSATSVLVSNVTTGTENAGKGQKYGTATVTVTNDLGDPVSGASVTGDFSGTWTETQTATTDAQGVASFVTSTSQNGGVTVNFCVSSVTATDLTFDSANSTGICP